MLTRMRLWACRLLCPQGYMVLTVGDRIYGPDGVFVAVKFHDKVDTGQLVAWEPGGEFGVVSMEPISAEDAQ